MVYSSVIVLTVAGNCLNRASRGEGDNESGEEGLEVHGSKIGRRTIEDQVVSEEARDMKTEECRFP